MKELKPGVVIAVIVVVVAVAGGAWYFASASGTSGLPAVGQPGRADPVWSGPNSIMKQKMSVSPTSKSGTQGQPNR